MARPIKTHTASYDRSIKVPGLMKMADGRWRVLLADGSEKRFTQPVERTAVERARQLLGLDRQSMTAVEVPVRAILPDAPQFLDGLTEAHADRLAEFYE